MGNRLQQALHELDSMEANSRRPTPLSSKNAKAKITVTAVYLITMLSVPLTDLSDLLLFALFPVLLSAMCETGYGVVLRRSLMVVPFVVLIGIFNPFIDRRPMFHIGTIAITEGWITFMSIILRGMLSVQAVFLLIYSTGFHGVCRNLRHMGVPAVLTTQLLFVYRYMFVLLEQTLDMSRARDARSYGRTSYPFKTWSTMVGQLLVRSFTRAEQIHRAMLARGFNGKTESFKEQRKWRPDDYIFTITWCVALIALRLLCPAGKFS